MNKPHLLFMADFFADSLPRGAERCNEALIYYLSKSFYISKIRSRDVILDNSLIKYPIILSNFTQMRSQTLDFITSKCKYILYEHDHKYVPTRNPYTYVASREDKVPTDKLINLHVYKNAYKVVCQTEQHSQIVARNTGVGTIHTNGSIYSNDELDFISKTLASASNRSGALILSDNHKPYNEAIKFCIDHKIPYRIVSFMTWSSFIQTMTRFKYFVFFPEIPESCSRVLIEAKMLNCEVITNNNSGAATSEWWSKSGNELISLYKDVIIPEAIANIKDLICQMSTM